MRDARRRPIHSAFFLLGLIYSGAVMPLRLGVFAGDLVPHELCATLLARRRMLLGYVATILGGFLLTAAPNWTGRLPLHGTLLVPGSTWLAGRNVVVLISSIG
jgi:uncharacterized protein involved in response to NO